MMFFALFFVLYLDLLFKIPLTAANFGLVRFLDQAGRLARNSAGPPSRKKRKTPMGSVPQKGFLSMRNVPEKGLPASSACFSAVARFLAIWRANRHTMAMVIVAIPNDELDHRIPRRQASQDGTL